MPRPGAEAPSSRQGWSVTSAVMLSRRCSRREPCSRRAAGPHARVCGSQVIGNDVIPRLPSLRSARSYRTIPRLGCRSVIRTFKAESATWV